MSVDFNEEKEFDLFLLIQQCNFEKLTELFAIHYFPDVNVLKEYHQNGIFIAESPIVIERALDAGYEPISLYAISSLKKAS